jgi:multidrug efflux pump
MSLFFVHRPVFAWVLAIVTMLAGVYALTTLSVSQYPDIAPTTVRVSASYPGATATAVESSVTQVIEDELTGLDGLLYMVSASSEGSSSTTLTFDESVDPIDAQNEVQSKVQQVEARLPDAVRRNGVDVSRSTSSILLVGALVSTNGGHGTVELGDIISTTVSGAVQRIEGVGGVSSFGSGYAMRIWLDPMKLAQYQLTPADIVSAVQEQNTTVSVGAWAPSPQRRGSSSPPRSPLKASCPPSRSSRASSSTPTMTRVRCTWATWRGSRSDRKATAGTRASTACLRPALP